LQIEANDTSKHLVSDTKSDNVLCEITSSHVKTHVILNDHSFDSNSVIVNLQFEPTSKSRFFNLLCCLLSMLLVRPILMLDVFKSKQGFIHGYRSGSAVFYISIVDNQMKTEDVTSKLVNF
jgi:hypothetical protein